MHLAMLKGYIKAAREGGFLIYYVLKRLKNNLPVHTSYKF